MAKIAPAQLRLHYLANMTSNQGTFYIDLAKDLSAINRRLYRQGMMYYIESYEHYNVFANDEVQTMICSTMGDTWTVHNAWTKAFKTWKRQQRDAQKAAGFTGPVNPKWEDFKIYLDDSHRAGGTGSATGDELATVAADGGAVGAGEWVHSKFVYSTDADGALREPYLHMIGGDVSTTDVGLILGYQDSRRRVSTEEPEVPDEASTNIYALMATNVDEVADDIIQNMEDENDEPPYDLDDYVGNDTNTDVTLTQSMALASPSQPLAIGSGFAAPCGLVKVEFGRNSVSNNAYSGNPDSQVAIFSITLAAGPYKGCMAEPMGQ